MPPPQLIKYFGDRTKEFGRPLWEIVLNLKNFGKGRYVTRPIIADKYPKEPCFYKIVHVRPHFIEYPETFEGNILVEEVHRGVARREPIDIGEVAGTCGFCLVLKEDEPKLLKWWEEYKANPLPINVLPRTAPLPPIWKLLLARERGIKPEQVPEIPIAHPPIEPGVGDPRRLAEPAEQPTFRIGPGNWTPKYPQFLKHVVKQREAALEAFPRDKELKPDFVYLNKALKPVDIADLVDVKKTSSEARQQQQQQQK